MNLYTLFEIMDDEVLANRVEGKIKTASFANEAKDAAPGLVTSDR